MNMGYAHISPVLGPNTLPAGAIQEWIIQSPASLPITFSFASFNFGPICSSRLTIFNNFPSSTGKVIFSGCKSSDFPSRWIYSQTGRALVVLQGGAVATKVSFALTYFANAELYKCGSFLSPDALLDNSMIITDGSLISNNMRQGAQCSWIITPQATASPSTATVTLVMLWVSLKNGGNVIVYDGSSASGNVLWNSGSGPTTITPPPLTTSGSAMFIVYTSNGLSASGYTGFRGQYYSNFQGSVGLGQGFAQLSMSSATDLVPPGTGTLTTPNTTYVWYISPNSASGPLSFVFSSLNLSAYDSLVLRDGPDLTSRVLQRFSGRQTPHIWFRTSSTQATLSFTSAPAALAPGNFKLSYFSDGSNYHCGFPLSSTASLQAVTSTITDGSASTSSLFINQQCSWNIAPTGASAIFIFFTYFGMNGGTVTLFNGPVSSGNVLAVITGSGGVPAPVAVSSSVLGVTYSSGPSATGIGFSASYFGISNTLYSGPGDGIIRLHSSSLVGLSAKIASQSQSSTAAAQKQATSYMYPNTQSNLTWLIRPQGANGSIYIAVQSLNMSDCATRLEILDGASAMAPLLGPPLCGNALPQPYKWIRTSSTAALLRLISQSPLPSDFNLAYYADGPSINCGYTGLQGTAAQLTAPSMILTDGSGSTKSMVGSQSCRWKITRPSNSSTFVVEFLESDLRGGSLVVYNGPDSTASILWACYGCTTLPNTLLSTSMYLYVQFSTSSSAPVLGTGFRFVYWVAGQGAGPSQSGGRVLELPQGYNLDTTNFNATTATSWRLSAKKGSTELLFAPRLVITPKSRVGSYQDGRSADSLFHAPASTALTCGIVQGAGAGSAVLSGVDVVQQTSQFSNSYLQTSRQGKVVNHIQGSFNTSLPVSSGSILGAARTCKYLLSTGSPLSMTIKIESFRPGIIGRLRIFGGVEGDDALLMDTGSTVRSPSFPMTVVAPCGQALIILSYNASMVTSLPTVNYGFKLNYSINAADTGFVCSNYSEFIFMPICSLLSAMANLLFALVTSSPPW